ncbi:MAG: M48 family metalloprotease [Cyanobacteria bacterium P01_G01_bin.54]
MKLSRSVLMLPLLWAGVLGVDIPAAIAAEFTAALTQDALAQDARVQAALAQAAVQQPALTADSPHLATTEPPALVVSPPTTNAESSRSPAPLPVASLTLSELTVTQLTVAQSAPSTPTTDAPEATSTDEPEATEAPITPTANPTKDPDPPQSTQVSTDPLPLSEADQIRKDLLTAGDRHWLAGEIPEATSLYQEAKPPFDQETDYEPPATAIHDPTLLSPAGSVYWRHFQAGLADNLLSKITVPAELLIEEQPQFIPVYLAYSQHLQRQERYERAVEVLAGGAAVYPGEPELVAATIAAYGQTEQWLEASLLARQFALFAPEHPEAEAFEFLADENFDRYRGKLKRRISNNIIGGILTSIASFALTGNIFGPLSTAQTTILLLQGEERIGERIANQVLDVAPMLEDETVLAYVDEIGQALAVVAGRDEFTYEFHVILDENLNAFALPGGKIFINAGAIVQTETEAELAGLLAHEIAHSALSHGFQLVSRGQLTANVVGNLPLGGLATNLLVFGYSRDMERQADRLGTRILASSGYAADGVRNLMQTLEEQNNPSPPAWLSTHPDTSARVDYLEVYILEHQLNRYAFEGVERHSQMRDRTAQLLADYQHFLDRGDEEVEEETTPEPETGGLLFRWP